LYVAIFVQVKLKEFKILRTIGTGSHGRVSLVQHQTSLKFYAMKILNKTMVKEISRHKIIKSCNRW